MLVTMRELMAQAEKGNYAVGGFNCPGLEYVLGVIGAAEATGKPVILSFPQVHEKTVPLKVIGPILLAAAERASVPVCVHLDHGSTIEYVQQALELGFNSVMYDGSKLSLEENIKNTQEVVKLAHKVGADVEAELGGIAGDEAGISTGETAVAALTDPDDYLITPRIELSNTEYEYTLGIKGGVRRSGGLVSYEIYVYTGEELLRPENLDSLLGGFDDIADLLLPFSCGGKYFLFRQLTDIVIFRIVDIDFNIGNNLGQFFFQRCNQLRHGTF